MLIRLRIKQVRIIAMESELSRSDPSDFELIATVSVIWTERQIRNVGTTALWYSWMAKIWAVGTRLRHYMQDSCCSMDLPVEYSCQSELYWEWKGMNPQAYPMLTVSCSPDRSCSQAVHQLYTSPNEITLSIRVQETLPSWFLLIWCLNVKMKRRTGKQSPTRDQFMNACPSCKIWCIFFPSSFLYTKQ